MAQAEAEAEVWEAHPNLLAEAVLASMAREPAEQVVLWVHLLLDPVNRARQVGLEVLVVVLQVSLVLVAVLYA
jgi:hypothetical protein